MERDLTKLSESEHQDAIARLARLPLKELRRRQELVEKQKAQAGLNRVDQHSVAWRNLAVMDIHLTQAILQKEFKNDANVRSGIDGLRRNGAALSDSEISHAVKWCMRKFGLNATEARKLVESGRYQEINDAVYEWAGKHGVSQSSPLARGYLLDLLSGREKLKMNRNGTSKLDSIRVLFRLPDTLALYGIPYDLRPGQSPKDLHSRYREGWIFLGYPGWAGPISSDDAQEISEFLAKHEGNIPEGPYEWTRLEPELPFVNVGEGRDTMNVRIANPGDYNLRVSLFYFSFGAYGDLHVLVWSKGVEDALETAAEYMKDEGHIGIFVDDENLKELAIEAREELGPDASDDEIYEQGTADLTYTESGYIPSFEWWVDEVTDPSLLSAAKAASEAYDKRTDLNFPEDDEELS